MKRRCGWPGCAQSSSQSSTTHSRPTAASGRTISRWPRSPVMTATIARGASGIVDGEKPRADLGVGIEAGAPDVLPRNCARSEAIGEAFERGGERGGVARRNEQTVDAVVDDVGQTADARGDDAACRRRTPFARRRFATPRDTAARQRGRAGNKPGRRSSAMKRFSTSMLGASSGGTSPSPAMMRRKLAGSSWRNASSSTSRPL